MKQISLENDRLRKHRETTEEEFIAITYRDVVIPVLVWNWEATTNLI